VSDLKVIEQDGLIKVYETSKGERVVDARELYEGLESKQDFSTWAKARLNECDALENVDFSVFHKKMENDFGLNLGRPSIEYIVKLEIAKEMAMLERNDQGKKYRKYLIEIEDKYKQQAIDISKLPPELQMFNQIFLSVASQQIQVNKLQSTVDVIKDTIVQRPDNWRKEINEMLNKIAYVLGENEFRNIRTESYKLLSVRAGVRLEQRLENLKRKLFSEGHSKTAIKVCKLDCVEDDKKLREIYTAIVKEYMIKYVA